MPNLHSTKILGDLRVTGLTNLNQLGAVTLTGQLTSAVATGTAPFVIASTTAVTNLNADLLDGNHASAFYLATNPSGYTSNTGTITGVTAGAGLSGGGTSGTVTLDLDFSELTDMTGDISGTTEFILQNGTTESRKAASEIKLSAFNNDSGWTSNAGTVTSVGGTGTVAGLTLSGTVTTTGNLTLSGTLSTPVSTINDSTTVGQNLVKLANPSAIRFIRINADNTVTALSDSDFRSAIGAGTGNGSVTSVGLTAGTGISISGGPITSSGSITVTNSAPDQVVALTGAGSVSVSGTYPNFTITGAAGVTYSEISEAEVDSTTSDTTRLISGRRFNYGLRNNVTATTTANFGTGATANAATKTVNLGTGGVSGSTTNINIGSTIAGTTTISSPTVSIPGNLTVGGNITVNNVEMISTSNGIIFEGSTNDDFETILTAINPTADRTISLPDSSGTVALTSDLHTRSHTMTSTSDHTAGNWKVFHSNGSGNVVELALGTANHYLKSNGAAAAPSFAQIAYSEISGTPTIPTGFTITANATDGLFDITGTNGTNAVTYAVGPYAAKQTTLQHFYLGTTNPTVTTRLNLDASLYATTLYSGGNEVYTSANLPAYPTVGNGALTFAASGTAGSTNTTVTVETGTGFTANSSSAATYNYRVGPALTALASTMTGTGSGFLRKNGADTYTIDTNTYLTAHPTISVTTDTTSTASPAFGGTFTAIDSVTRDGNGHVTTLNTKTVTLPTPNYPTGFSISAGATDGLFDITGTGGTNSVSYAVAPYASKQTTLQHFYLGTTAPTITTRLNLDAALYATQLYDNGSRVLTAHPAVSAASSSDNSGRTYIQDILLDSFGHVTGITTATETVVDTNTTYTLGVPESTTAIRLTGSDSTTNDVTLTAGSNVSITRNSANQLTIASSFTDTNTATAANNILQGSNSGTQITYAPYSTQQSFLSMDTSSTNPTRTDRLNINASLHTTNVNVHGNILLTGTATETNQARTIDFTGFDKETTADFSDRAFIQHTVNTGGHSGSVLVISSQNDATDGIAFSTNATSRLKHNSNDIFGAQFDATFTNAADRLINITSTAAGTAGRALSIVSGSTTAGTANIAGGNLNIRSGQSTGTASSSIVFQTPTPGASGTTLNALADRMTINSNGVSVDSLTAGNLTVTGTVTIKNVDVINTSSGIIFDGATANANKTTLNVVDPTATRSLLLPDASGTIATQEYVTGLGYTTNTGTVTSVAAGAGMNFTTFTTSGSVAMGTPSTLTDLTTNSASGTTHTHAITTYSVSGTANQITVTGAAKVLGAATTLSLPQNIHTAATPQFARIGLGVASSASPVHIKNATPEVKLEAGSTTDSGTMRYNTTTKSIEFIFA
jgi:hypothetical protein